MSGESASTGEGRRRLLQAAAALGASALAGGAGAQPRAPRVGRFMLPGNPLGLDPPGVAEVLSSTIVGSIFDSPLRYDYLARPIRLKPNTLAAMPEVSADFRHFVFTLRPGIFFADDPAFGGRPRELVAADQVYSIKRVFDPRWRSPNLFQFEAVGIVGMAELRRAALAPGARFDYDREVPGLRVLDRYRFELHLERPAPRLAYLFANTSLTGAVAREVVEAYGDQVVARPVGTGPYRLVEWVRNSRIVLERNPRHRHGIYDETPEPGDAAEQALAERWRGRPMPFLDRVEISIVDEAQPRWLSFLQGDVDLVGVPFEFNQQAAPNGQLAPYLAARGVQLTRLKIPQTVYLQFGMEHAVVGGYTLERVALRRAIALAYDREREIALVRGGLAEPAQSLIAPWLDGYDPGFRSDAVRLDVPRARALLDLYGYADRNGDGWREQPDGSPLVLEVTSGRTQLERQLNELWQASMRRIGLRMRFTVMDSVEITKLSRNGRVMLRYTAWNAPTPETAYYLSLLDGASKGQSSNHSRFDLPAYNALLPRQAVLPDGPERQALIRESQRIALAWMPLVPLLHPMFAWVAHRRLRGYKPHPFLRDYFRYVDVDDAA